MKLRFPGSVRVGAPKCWGNIVVQGLKVDVERPLDYALAAVNFRRGKLKVLELSSVGEARFISISSRPTLVLEGTRLIGGRQDRAVNSSVFIPPNSEAVLAVSCVEHNRWHARRGVDPGTFSIAEELSPPRQRHVFKSSSGGTHRASQSAVWESVDETVTSLDAGDGGGSLSQAFEAVQPNVGEARDALSYVEGSNGIAVFVGGRLRSLDIFNNTRKMAQSWQAIVAAHLVEASAEPKPSEAPTGLDETLAALETTVWDSVPAASLGTEARSRIGQEGRATYLSHEGALVHASVVLQ